VILSRYGGFTSINPSCLGYGDRLIVVWGQLRQKNYGDPIWNKGLEGVACLTSLKLSSFLSTTEGREGGKEGNCNILTLKT
jgi:hypothetical protein